MSTSKERLGRYKAAGTLAEIDFYKHGQKDNRFIENSVGWYEYEQTWDLLEMEENGTREPDGYDEPREEFEL